MQSCRSSMTLPLELLADILHQLVEYTADGPIYVMSTALPLYLIR